MLAYVRFGELFDNVSSGFCRYAGSMLVQFVALVLAIFLLDCLIRRRVRAVFRYWIWVLVVVKLMLPPSLSAPTGIAYWCARLLPDEKDAAATISPDPDFRADVVATDSADRDGAEAFAAAPVLSWRCGLAIVWLTGVLLLSSWLIHRLHRIHQLMQTGREPDALLAQLFEECRRRAGARWAVSLRIIDDAGSPAVFGVFRPTVLLPSRICDRLDRDQLRTVLLHELTHVARGDLVVHAVQVMLQILHFYNPLVWLVNLRIERLREQAVDEAVLVALGNPAEYSHTLVEVAALSTGRASLSLGLMGVVESRVALAERLSHILSRPVPSSARLGTVGFVFVVALAAACIPMSGSRAETGRPVALRNEPVDRGPVIERSAAPVNAAVPAFPSSAPAMTAVDSRPRFRCDEPTYDFGEAWDGGTVEHVFVMHNDGDSPLQIEAKPTCGCTITKDYDKTIAPRAEGRIPAVLRLSSYQGSIRKQIVVTTNDAANTKFTLALVGNVRQRISMDPPSGLNWGRYAAGMLLTRTVKVTNNTSGTMQLQTLPGAPSVFLAAVREIQPGKTAEVTVTATPPFAQGVNAATLKFATGIVEKPEFTLPCSLSVPPAIEVTPPRISIQEPATGELQRTVRITCNDEGTLKLASVTAEPAAIGTQVVETVAGKVFNLCLTIPAGLELSPSRPGRITMQTNRPDKPEIQVDIFATPTPASRPAALP